ncbi:MAG: hypothetical protein BWY71_00187 [Planctomycetes bacterium ADurb.Bin412]|nr:MAG: hypothetical protein BWY71_00187 [Planctomycetes bacterium ADurb.Bin412]
MQFTKTAIADQFAGKPDTAAGTLVTARLQNPLISFYRLANGPAFRDGIHQRLLAIDVLAGLGGGDGNQAMPMVGRANRDRVDIRAGQQFAEIVIAVAALVGAVSLLLGIILFRTSAGGIAAGGRTAGKLVEHVIIVTALVDITDCDHLDIGLFQKRQHIPRPLPPGSDAAHDDAIAGSHRAIQSQGGRGNDIRETYRAGGGQRGLLQKFPSGYLHGMFLFKSLTIAILFYPIFHGLRRERASKRFPSSQLVNCSRTGSQCRGRPS